MNLLLTFVLKKKSLFPLGDEIAYCTSGIYLFKVNNEYTKTVIVGKGGHTPPFLDQHPLFSDPPFLYIQDVPTFYMPIVKTKALNDSFN